MPVRCPVVRADGTPVEDRGGGLRPGAHKPAEPLSTDRDGTVSIELAPGSYAVTAAGPDLRRRAASTVEVRSPVEVAAP